MSGMEIIVFIASSFGTFFFVVSWYYEINTNWPAQRNRRGKTVMRVLPVVAFAIMLPVLMLWASYDVVDSLFFIIFYLVLGYTWVWVGLLLCSYFLDISWRDDAIQLNNRAGLVSVTSMYIGLTLIFTAANIGDGPGWWCVLVAAGMGLASWLLLAIIINKATSVSETITVNRDIWCALRFGGYLLGSSILLARASAGDWTSFNQTVKEFGVGWPVLLLAPVALAVELVYHRRTLAGVYREKQPLPALSVLWALAYIVFALICVALLPPLTVNPYYR